MAYDDIRIRYDVNYYKVVDKISKEVIPNVVWIDEEHGEYGVLDADVSNIVVVKQGQICLRCSRRQDRRRGDRRDNDRRVNDRRK